jgi:hypothetical protein
MPDTISTQSGHSVADDEILTPLPGGEEPLPAKKGLLSRLGPLEWGSMGFIVLLLIAGWWTMVHFLYREQSAGGGLAQGTQAAKTTFAFPMKGEVATIESITHGWRDRVSGDRAKPDFTVLPFVRIKTAGGQGPGFIRVWFVDSKGQPQGDIATLKLDNGQFKDVGRGEKLISPQEAEIACTFGFKSNTEHQAYLANADRQWRLKVEQGVDYSKGPWVVLGENDLDNQKN